LQFIIIRIIRKIQDGTRKIPAGADATFFIFLNYRGFIEKQAFCDYFYIKNRNVRQKTLILSANSEMTATIGLEKIKKGGFLYLL